MHKVYKLLITNSAQKEIRTLQKTEVQKIIPAIQSLSENPRPSGCKKLVSVKNIYRIRIGNYRVLYSIDDLIRIVEISGVEHRREAYE
ncbi:type II toxin-antitoxin system RelE/ParE family toxin [Dyadobacter sp. LHD-138]|uniref:type II toxin-antitoxin system RelE family toxin n=1 Tax=Dyadobacter sp. LHD-138 TaxID=3071413 RepID=UPI0027E1F168|nr:type II toxin-antitoxin system RelE/ParE family toxin [Dyadobacter sp. LHD-138]MDQ6481741.1 type II toxin-antitoxin system RelE/ParE family toxin [Dyadobacter sp. LHD-138]